MFDIIFVEPETPPNTGNVIRLYANTGVQLHLIEPLGFPFEDARMRRADLDYREYATMRVYVDWGTFLRDAQPDPTHMFVLTTRGSTPFASVALQPGGWFAFGSETRGLPEERREWFPASQRIRLSIRSDDRSLNLSNTVAVVVFEAWRQNGFVGGVWV